MTVTGLLAAQLTQAGHHVIACTWCGGALAADLTHDGRPLPQGTRRYCSKAGCRSAARNARRRPLANARRALVRTHGELIRYHQLEQAGQAVFDGFPALPAVPPIGAMQ